MIRVLVATGVRAYHEGLQRVLLSAEGIALVATVSTPELAVEETCKLLPSVLLLDLDMARRLALAGQIAGTPGVRGVVLLGRPEAYSEVIYCLPAEVLAFVAHDATVAQLLSAIRAAGGDQQAAPDMPVEGLSPRGPGAIAHLTGRELEILRLIQQGLPNKTISRQLGIGLSTVKNHVHSILTKLGAHNRGEATSLLFQYEGAGDDALDQPAVA